MGCLYLYGMILATQHLRAKQAFPKADTYCELAERRYGVGGETGTAAIVLASLGCRVRAAGTHLGSRNCELIRSRFGRSGIDASELVYDEAFPGVEDTVVIAGSTRTCFGQFGALFSGGLGWTEPPSETSVRGCATVGCDPFFGDEIARLCVRNGKPYAVIDCTHDSYFNRHCAVNAVSHEFLDEHYPGVGYRELLRLYTDNTDGLVIFTQGEGKMLYGRRGGALCELGAYRVEVAGTLGAGDSFKAGTIYGLANGFDDRRLVEFSAATAAYSCSHYPIDEHPATLEGVERIIAADHR